MSQEITNDARRLLEDLEQRGELKNEKKVLSFCCSCCRLIWDKLPQIAQDALRVSEKYINDSATPRDLEEARVNLWNYLDENNSDTKISNIAAVRAVICCLYPIKTKNEAFDCMDYTMDFCNCVEDRYSEQYYLLLEIFKD
jgi:hypothetical protein